MSRKMQCAFTTPGYFCIRPHGHTGPCAWEKAAAQPAPSRQWGQLRKKQEEVVHVEGSAWNCVVPPDVLDAAVLLTEWTAKMGFKHWRIAGCANAESGPTAYRLSTDHITAPVSAWNYDMNTCPVGVKCFLLNLGGVATLGPVDARGKKFFMAWAPMPQRDKEEEKRRGLNR